jgi:hypothetical protein
MFTETAGRSAYSPLTLDKGTLMAIRVDDRPCYEVAWAATANEVARRCSIAATTRASISGVVCR